MRTTRKLFIALSTLTAITLAFASSAGADTALCKVHEKEPCAGENVVSSAHLVNTEGTIAGFLNNFFNILCLGALTEGNPLEAGSQQVIHTTTVSFAGCGTTASHNNCTVTVEELPLFVLLSTGLNLGALVAETGRLRVTCSSLFFNCSYKMADTAFDVEGALYEETTGEGMVTAASSPLPLASGGFCPKETGLDLLLESLEEFYVTSTPEDTALCSVHENPCGSKNLLKTLHTSVTTPATMLLTYEENPYSISCEEALTSTEVGKLGIPQVLTVTALTWSGCELEGNECSIELVKSGTLEIFRTGLNSGYARSTKNEIEVNCAEPNIVCKFAGEPTLGLEGAGHTEGAGHGMFKANRARMEVTEGECEGFGHMDALYEPSSDVFVVS